ncbi:glycine betaine ABC transporter substrate-binding protein [Pseudonocardia petroleophila]|uniref:Glycine betaine ABC transporter substrate-binding protein n=1 Tax=Pseudonocardia petroleophila TaxID=37331 RepID=A0A7G7MLX4_9PSEU|nr:glycine betaine ABC transporter substrate-binding protein [Pseudonocardia petroleophila]QNG53785.1 glycine betaine ABC transporter substrate-binding protein [Pseudonocardia petroleophila]
MSWTSRGSRRTATAAAAALAAVALAGCGGLEASGPSAAGGGLSDSVSLEGQSYAVGGKDFDEQLVLCQVAVAALESVQATVTDRCNVGGTQATRDALLAGDIDLYWDYNGTGWITFLGETTPIPDEEEQYVAVRDRDLAENDIHWIGRTPFNNTYAFAVKEEKAAELNLTTLSDMAAYINSGQPGSVCIETEYASRDDGISGLQTTYGFQVPAPTILQTGAIYQATADGDCLFGLVFTTDGRIPQLGLRVLEDDKRYHPNYNASVTVRGEAYDRDPNISQVFEPIAAALDDATMAELNKQVSADGLAPREVARTWLAEQGFIGAA